MRLVVVGTSTGGPAALTRLLAALPADFPAAVAIALHIPAGYTETLARRLDETCPMRVIEAFEGAELAPGTVAIARGGLHLRVKSADGRITAHVDAHPLTAPFCPSVDLLFESAAALGPAALGVVLTGMGNDGLVGATAIRRAGGRVVTEAEGSASSTGCPARSSKPTNRTARHSSKRWPRRSAGAFSRRLSRRSARPGLSFEVRP